jgi:hypothetical protein
MHPEDSSEIPAALPGGPEESGSEVPGKAGNSIVLTENEVLKMF